MNADWSTTWIDNEHPALRRCWHPVARSADIGSEQPVAVDLLGERWCLVRLGGELAALRDPCPHRYSPLSAGTIEGDTLRCASHGFRFAADRTGAELPPVAPGVQSRRCRRFPSTTTPASSPAPCPRPTGTRGRPRWRTTSSTWAICRSCI